MTIQDFFCENRKLLIGVTAAAYLTYEGIQCIRAYLERKRNSEFVPVGVVKSLHIYPIKSGKGHSLFSFLCSPTGPVSGELIDRKFLVIDGKTGKFYTARQKPRLILLESCIVENVLSIKAPDGRTIDIGLDEVKKRKDIRPAFLFEQLRQDGYDCGEDVAKFLSEYIEESNTRLLMWDKNLYTERNCVTNDNWWNNPVPKRKDEVNFVDLTPYMIINQASVDDLNKRLEKKVTSTNFRPVILVDKCRAYDEDKWAEVRIGDVELQCFKPCDRCVLTTVDPETGVKDPNNQPLKKLREYRLAPEGKMRKEYKDSPMFGVCAGTNKPGYIHVGQTVYARYKTSEF